MFIRNKHVACRDIIYKKPYEDRRMQKRKRIYTKNPNITASARKKIQQICIAAGGVLLLVVLIPIVRGCAGKTKSVNSSNVTNATDEKTTGSALSSGSEKKRTILHLPMELSRLQNLPVTAQIHLLIPKAAILFQQNRSTTPQSPLTISVVGDCTLGTDEAFDYSTSLNAYFENYGKEYFYRM